MNTVVLFHSGISLKQRGVSGRWKSSKSTGLHGSRRTATNNICFSIPALSPTTETVDIFVYHLRRGHRDQVTKVPTILSANCLHSACIFQIGYPKNVYQLKYSYLILAQRMSKSLYITGKLLSRWCGSSLLYAVNITVELRNSLGLLIGQNLGRRGKLNWMLGERNRS